MLVFDTNVLVYADDEDSQFHDVCRELVSPARRDGSQSFLASSIRRNPPRDYAREPTDLPVVPPIGCAGVRDMR